MTTKTYLGEKHIFTSKTDGLTTEISAGKNEELYISDLRNKRIFYSENSDTLGFNQLSNAATYQHSDTTNLQNQGTSLSIVDVGTDSYLTIGAPIPGTDLGGVGPFKSTSGAAFIEASALLQTSTTSDAQNAIYSDINEDGDLIVFTDYAQNSSNIQTYRRSGATWSSSDLISGAGGPCKLSGNYLLTGTNGEGIDVRFYNGSSWSLQQELLAAPGPDSGSFLENIGITNEDTAVYADSESVYVWTRNLTTWGNIQTFPLSDVSGLSLSGLVLALITSTGQLLIFERPNLNVVSIFTLKNTFDVSGLTSVSTNGTYVFASTSTAIRIYEKIGSSWVRSFNNTSDTGITKLACSENWLACGKPTSDSGNGGVTVYEISSYINSLVTTNSIAFSGTDLELTSSYGNITFSPGVTTSVGLYSNGSETAPSIAFSTQSTTGLYKPSDNNLAITVAGDNKLNVGNTITTSTNPLVLPVGDLTNPSVAFAGSTDTGLYSYTADTFSFVSNGTNVGTVSGQSTTLLNNSVALNCFFSITGNAAQSIPNNTVTTLTSSYWNGTPVLQGYGTDIPSYSNGIVTLPQTGIYICSYTVHFASNATGVRSSRILINSNTSVDRAYTFADAVSVARTSFSNSFVEKFTAGDTVELAVYQNTGGALNTDTAVLGRLVVYRIG